MKTFSDNFFRAETAKAKEPRYVVQVSWDADDTDYTYFTSSSDAALPATSPPVDSVHGAVYKISGQTQTINPDMATSTIGSVTIQLLDLTTTASPQTPQVTSKIQTKLVVGDGLREKIVRVYVGYPDMPFTEYEAYGLRLTYIVDTVSYKDGVYTIRLSDIQRSSKHKIFTPAETTLNTSIDDKTHRIPITTSDIYQFPMVRHGNEWTVSPGRPRGYIKIEDEVVSHRGIAFDTTIGYYFIVVERGALNTRPAEHKISEETEDSRKLKIKEHVYIEAAGTKAIYAIETGILAHGDLKIPIDDVFDLNNWTPGGTPVIAASSQRPPSGWGEAYDITDDDGASYEYILKTNSADYTHGSTWALSVFVKKESASREVGLVVNFSGGAAASQAAVTFDAFDGSIPSFTNTNSISSIRVDRYDENWWFLSIAATSATTGTTAVNGYIYPALTTTPSTGTATFWMAALVIGSDPIGWTLLPGHWHLGINQKFVRFSDFSGLGYDYWYPFDDSGKLIRIENPGTKEGKQYIEKEILLWLGSFMPIYSDGQIGIKKLANVLPFSSYQAHLNSKNIVNYSDVKHDMRAVINNIRVLWNWVDLRDDFTKENIFIDSTSIQTHQIADTKEYKFHTVHTGAHTDEDLLTYFDTLRDRYAGPPMRLSLQVLPGNSAIEVGDKVRVTLDQIRDFNTSFHTVDRTFEVQRVSTDWMTGNLNLTLFGSTQRASEIKRTTLTNVLLDTFYTSAGTNLTSVLTITAGAVTASGTLIGNASSVDNAIFYYDGNLTINAGVTVTLLENVQLRIKGTLTINGKIAGVGTGATGGTATTQFVGGGTTDTESMLYNPVYDDLKDLDVDLGEQGYFGTTIPASSLLSRGFDGGTVIQADDRIETSSNWVNVSTPGWPTNGLGSTISRGVVDEVPYFSLTNDQQTNTLSGYPLDLRGNSGGGGVPLMRMGMNFSAQTTTWSIQANSGSGGNGGAGLLIVSRGLSFGGSGQIDLSGGASGGAASYTSGGGDKFYAGQGAPGAPGAFVLLLDGNVTNPDIDDTKFVAKYGRNFPPVGSSEVGLSDISFLNSWGGLEYYTFATWPGGDIIWNEAPGAATEITNVSNSAYRMQYIPADQTPELSEDSGSLVESLLYNVVQMVEGIPTSSNVRLGVAMALSEDNQRFAYTQGDTSLGTVQILIDRGVENPITEHTISVPNTEDVNAGKSIHFNNTADVFFEGRPQRATNSGAVEIWTRSGTTWTNTQTINWGTTNSFFGATINCRGNGRSEGFFAQSQAAGAVTTYTLNYYENTGASWVFQQGVTNPVSPPQTSHAGKYNAHKMSSDAQWYVFGDEEYDDATGTEGCICVFERTGTGATTWAFRARLFVDRANNYMGQKVAINANGEVFATSSSYFSATSPVTLDGRVYIYQRDDDRYYLHQELPSPLAGSKFGNILAMTDDGLTLVISAELTVGNTTLYTYKRGAKSLKFKLFDTTEISGLTINLFDDYVLSRNGKYLIISDNTYQSVANFNGAIIKLENQFRLEKQ